MTPRVRSYKKVLILFSGMESQLPDRGHSGGAIGLSHVGLRQGQSQGSPWARHGQSASPRGDNRSDRQPHSSEMIGDPDDPLAVLAYAGRFIDDGK